MQKRKRLTIKKSKKVYSSNTLVSSLNKKKQQNDVNGN